jgi:hypothetical protein
VDGGVARVVGGAALPHGGRHCPGNVMGLSHHWIVRECTANPYNAGESKFPAKRREGRGD